MSLFKVACASDSGSAGDGDALGGYACCRVYIVQSSIVAAYSDGNEDFAIVHHRNVACRLPGSDVELVGQSRDICVCLRLHINDGIMACGPRRGGRLLIVELQQEFAASDRPYAAELISA